MRDQLIVASVNYDLTLKGYLAFKFLSLALLAYLEYREALEGTEVTAPHTLNSRGGIKLVYVLCTILAIY